MNPFAWYLNNSTSMEPKTHHRRNCKECLSFGLNAGCSLPFRRTRKRWWKGFRLEALKEKVYEFKYKQKTY